MAEPKKIFSIPEQIPVLPVRNTVLFPSAAIPLMVGRPRSVKAVQQASKNQDVILVVAQRDGSKSRPRSEDLYRVGVVCTIAKLTALEEEGYQLLANGQFRYRVLEYNDKGDYLVARGVQMAEISYGDSQRVDALKVQIQDLGKSILKLAKIPGADSLLKLFGQLDDPGQIADLCATFLQLPVDTKQKLLETENIELRLERLLEHMLKERDRLSLQNEIQAKMMERLSKDQRQHLLREQIRTIREELGDESDVQEEFAKKIDKAQLPPEVEKVAEEELKRLGSIQRSSPEYQVIRTYLDWLVALPWNKSSSDADYKIDLKKAREILDADHYGIDKVKRRIIQFLAVTKLKKDHNGPILCLVGPPGVGKTSLGQSVAQALGRKFVRASLGGVRDEAEIRGHRRTYIGSLPGRIIQSLKRVGVNDPVFLLDEIDKVGTDFRGDPASALLEVLDPEQNKTFADHYLDVPFDLSNVFFICTANVLDSIPPALRDRMEVIEMSSYTKQEKTEIARRHLIPKVVANHGIKKEQIEIPDTVVERVINDYTREAGVRQLKREIAQLCRVAAEQLATDEPPEKVQFNAKDLESHMGPQRFFDEKAEQHTRPGVATGLAWTPVGGEILKIETTKMAGSGKLILTGRLGDVMKESAQIALSLLRAYGNQSLRVDFDKTDFHIHVPSGAIPKDGPSAGTALFLSIASLLQQKSLDPKIAVSGEITLRGSILPVGGIKEKVVAAQRAGITEICLPENNRGDLVDVSDEVKKQIQFHFIRDIFDLTKIAKLESSIHLPNVAPNSPIIDSVTH